MIAVFYYALYLGLSGILILFLMRLYIGVWAKLQVKDLLFLLFVPGSIGLALKMKKNYPFENLYFYASIFFFLMTFIGSIFLLYMRLGLDIL